MSEVVEVAAEDVVEEGKKRGRPKGPKKEKVAKEKAAPKRGIGTVAREAILEGKGLEECVAAVKVEFPEAGTTVASIQWYRNDMKSKNIEIPQLARRKAAKKAEAEVDPLA